MIDPKDAEISTLKAELATAQKQVTDLTAQVNTLKTAHPIPPTLNSLLSNFINATQAFADVNVGARAVAKELGF